MLPPEIAKQIRLLEIRTNRTVDEITGGAYRSARKVILCVRSGYKTGAGLNCTCRMHRT